MEKKLTDNDISIAVPKRGKDYGIKKKLEKDIQREICDWLATLGYFFWRQNTIPVYEKGHFRALPKYTPRGLPDILILCRGRFIGLEVKVPDYWKFTNDQKAIKEKFIANGGEYHLVTSLAQAIEVMAAHML